MRIAVILSGILILWAPLLAQSLPQIETRSLSDKRVVIPDDVRGHTSLFIVGFSKKSKEPTSAWAKRAMAALAGDPSCVVYQVAVLEDVPRIFRGMVVSGIRGDLPNNLRDHFLIAMKDEPQWKQASGFSDADDAYILLTDKSGSVVWHTHGTVNDSALSDLQQRVKGLGRN